MNIAVLDLPEACANEQHWQDLAQLGTLHLFSSTTLPQLMERAQTADVLVTRSVPLRREILDYATRPKTLVVPDTEAERLVEMEIAAQLGIRVVRVASARDEDCSWPADVARALAAVLTE